MGSKDAITAHSSRRGELFWAANLPAGARSRGHCTHTHAQSAGDGRILASAQADSAAVAQGTAAWSVWPGKWQPLAPCAAQRVHSPTAPRHWLSAFPQFAGGLKGRRRRRSFTSPAPFPSPSFP